MTTDLNKSAETKPWEPMRIERVGRVADVMRGTSAGGTEGGPNGKKGAGL
jgi:hypothetical protein